MTSPDKSPKYFTYIEKAVFKDDIVSGLKEMGMQGWQVIHIQDKGSKLNGYPALDIIFMREV